MNIIKNLAVGAALSMLFFFVGMFGTQLAQAVPGFFANGGNSFLETATLGTTDNFDLRVITNNTEKARVTASGNVGIGTASPTSKLHVAGTANITGALSAGSLNLLGQLFTSGSAGTSGQVLTSNGSGSAPSWQTTTPGTWTKLIDETFNGGASSFTTSSFAAKRNLIVRLSWESLDASISNIALYFNGDSSSNYSYSYSMNGAGPDVGSNANYIAFADTFTGGGFADLAILNTINFPKRLTGTVVVGNNKNIVPEIIEVGGVWGNTSDQITSLTLVSGSTFGIISQGIRITVFGAD